MSPATRSAERLLALVRGGDFQRFLALAVELEPADLGDVLAQLTDERSEFSYTYD